MEVVGNQSATAAGKPGSLPEPAAVPWLEVREERHRRGDPDVLQQHDWLAPAESSLFWLGCSNCFCKISVWCGQACGRE